jgi:hypothetical protein
MLQGGVKLHGQYGFYFQHPPMTLGEMAAFDGILAGHYQRSIVGKSQFACVVRMMIAKSLWHDNKAELLQAREKPARIANARHSVHRVGGAMTLLPFTH